LKKAFEPGLAFRYGAKKTANRCPPVEYIVKGHLSNGFNDTDKGFFRTKPGESKSGCALQGGIGGLKRSQQHR
jgi:hypothetical protein